MHPPAPSLVRLLLMGLLASPVVAVDELLVRETFDGYTTPIVLADDAAASTAKAGIGWAIGEGWHRTAPWGSGSIRGGQIIAPGLGASSARIETLMNGGVSRRFARAIAPASGSAAWIGFRMKCIDLQTTAARGTANEDQNYISFMHSDFSGADVKFSMNTDGSRVAAGPDAGKVRWRLHNGADAPASVAVLEDTDQFVVLKIDSAGVTLWFDPTLASEPSGVGYQSVSIPNVTIDRIQVMTGHSSVAPTRTAAIQLDDFRVATSWNALISSTPTVITSVAPASGSTLGGTTLTISGSAFPPDATVTIGGTAATAVTVVNATTITARSPAHAAGTVDVVVANAGISATAHSGFTYVAGTAGAPVPITSPTITGTIRPGGGAVADPGTWDPPQTSFTYAWQRADDTSGTNLAARGTGQSYFPDASDLGKFLRVRVTPAGTSATADSAWVRCAFDKLTAAQFSAGDTAGSAGCTSGSGLALVGVLALLAFRRRR